MQFRIMKHLLLCLLLVYPLQHAAYADTTANVITSGPVFSGDTSDTALTSNVNNVISKNPLAQTLNVGVIVHNRIANLTGTLSDPLQASLIISIANSVPGINDVNTSQLNLTGGNPIPNDVILTAKVKGALVRDEAFGKITLDQLPIIVETNNGIVYLKGQVDNQSQLIYVVKIAQTTPGVPRVISELSVKLIPVHN